MSLSELRRLHPHSDSSHTVAIIWTQFFSVCCVALNTAAHSVLKCEEEPFKGENSLNSQSFYQIFPEFYQSLSLFETLERWKIWSRSQKTRVRVNIYQVRLSKTWRTTRRCCKVTRRGGERLFSHEHINTSVTPSDKPAVTHETTQTCLLAHRRSARDGFEGFCSLAGSLLLEPSPKNTC